MTIHVPNLGTEQICSHAFFRAALCISLILMLVWLAFFSSTFSEKGHESAAEDQVLPFTALSLTKQYCTRINKQVLYTMFGGQNCLLRQFQKS